jgi:hypothetical protein
MKRTLIIIGVAVGIVLFAGAGWYLSSRGTTTPSTDNSPSGGSSGLPTAGNAAGGNSPTGTGLPSAGATQSYSSEALAYFVRGDKSVLIVEPDGRISLTTSASSTLLNTQRVPDISKVQFSADGKKILVKASKIDALSPSWRVYDVDKNTWRELSIDTRSASFAPEGQRIAYFANRVSGETLTILDLQSSSLKPIALLSLAAEDLDLAWAGPTQIFFGERSSGNVSGSLWSINTNTRAVRKLLSDVAGAEIVWGKADQGLLFRAGQGGGTLSLVGNDLASLQDFSFVTLPTKCTFYMASSTETLLCAIPRNPQALKNALLPDDYETGAVMTVDDIVHIDLKTGTVIPVLTDPTKLFDVQSMTVSGNAVYFLNRWDNRVYTHALQ